MATDTQTSETLARPLPVRMRPDLAIESQRYHGRTYWIIKEPLGLNYYRFQEEEFFLLRSLDGRTSLEEVRRRFEVEFRPKKISPEEIAAFIGRLHQSGLLSADVPDQGAKLSQRNRLRRRRAFLAKATNILGLRIRGFDPDRLLTRLYPKVRWFFTPAALFLCAMLVLAAGVLVTVEFDVFRAKLPTFHDFFAAQNWIWLAAALAFTKVLHEFGHALVCKHFGGECHEMGVMLIVLTPCLYCNVSDSWMLPNKWHRAAIGAAGMYVEFVLAAVCTFLWWFSEPGMLNHLCLSVMFVSSVSTLLFNANPLLRFDGYYILADVLEIPNLRQKASTITRRKLAAWCLGISEPADPFLPRRHQGFFAFYTVAAAIYRWVVVVSILMFLYKVFEPYGLQVIGQAIALTVLYGMVVHPLIRLVKYFRVPGRLQTVKHARLFATLLVTAAMVAAVLLVPLPHHVICSLEIRPHNAAPVYVDVPGAVETVRVRAGQKVAAGAVLAKLVNLDERLALARLLGQRDEYQARLVNLRRQRHEQGDAGSEAALAIPQVQEALFTVEQQLKQKRRDLDRLALVAPAAGTVFPPPPKPHQNHDDSRLPGWAGTPLDPQNEGAFLEASVLFCQIGDPRALEAQLLIDQEDIEFVASGQAIEIQLDQLPGESFRSKIENIASAELKETPGRLSSKRGGELATTTDSRGRERPLGTLYQARALLADDEGILRIGLSGTARIRTPSQTLASRFWRYVSRTFNFEL